MILNKTQEERAQQGCQEATLTSDDCDYRNHKDIETETPVEVPIAMQETKELRNKGAMIDRLTEDIEKTNITLSIMNTRVATLETCGPVQGHAGVTSAAPSPPPPPLLPNPIASPVRALLNPATGLEERMCN